MKLEELLADLPDEKKSALSELFGDLTNKVSSLESTKTGLLADKDKWKELETSIKADNEQKEIDRKNALAEKGEFETMQRDQNWGDLHSLASKKAMLPYIKNMSDSDRDYIDKVKSSRAFATRFVNWRDSIEDFKMEYQPVKDNG